MYTTENQPVPLEKLVELAKAAIARCEAIKASTAPSTATVNKSKRPFGKVAS